MNTPIRRPRPTRMRSTILAALSCAAILAGLVAGPAAAASQHATRPQAPAGTNVTASVRTAPASTASLAAATPPTDCSSACDLWAESGTTTLPGGQTVNVWGYTSTDTAATAPGGPVLVVPEGATFTITLHNKNMPSATSLMIAGLPVPPDTIGVAAGSTKSYTFTADRPGTFLYEAGLTPSGPRQVAMGLYGALIVRPTGCASCAYDAASAFDDEATLVLGEIDPTFNANPMTAILNDRAPTYWLINGKAYPQTDPIPTAAGHTVLLRYVNAGLQHHSMGLLGLHQSVIARDGRPEANPLRVVADTVPTGGTIDALVSIPASPPADAQWALFDAGMLLHNDGKAGSPANPNPAYTPVAFGGMLTFLTTSGGVGGSSGPTTSAVALTPNPTNGSVAVTLSATVSGTPDQAEYFVDALGADGTGCAITGILTSISVAIPVSGATAPCADLTTLASGNHTFYVQAHDTNGWGAPASAVLHLDKTGPAVSAITLVPNPTNGSLDVSLGATASDAATGDQTIKAAEYTIDGGASVAITVPNPPTVSASLSATISAATLGVLAQGPHTISVRAQDALDNWGAYATASLALDTSGPAATGLSAGPTPNNGTLGVQISSGGAFYVRIDATISDPLGGGVHSNVAAAEYFFDTLGSKGAGGLMFPADGSYNSPTEAVYAAVDLINIAALSEGTHTIYVRGRDASGNWGDASTTTLVIDKTAPTTSGVTLTPPASNNTAVAVAATATDPLHNLVQSNIAGGELFIDSVGATGTGIAMTAATAAATSAFNGTIPAARVAALSAGNHTVYVRARDTAGNWGPTATAILLIDRTAPTFSGITLNPNAIVAGTASIGLTVNGASDGAGGSGVAGGEWWIGSTNITPGTGTAFTGLSATIPTASLAAGTYTVRVRTRDVAGNWSTGTNGVRIATLTVAGDLIFQDGFETGNTSAWSSQSTNLATRLSVTAGAALVGTRGLQAQGTNTNYVQENFTPATSTFDARFYFNPNGNTSGGQDILATATATNFATQVFHVRYRMNLGQSQVQIQVGATPNGTWTSLTNGASNRIEVTSTAGGSLVLYVGGVSVQTLSAGAASVSAIRLGAVTAGSSTTLMYFDAFSAKRSTSPLVGP